MATADASGPLARVREYPRATVAVVSVIGYVAVIGTFAGVFPIFPELTQAEVNLLSHAIAVVNTVATVSLALGWYWIRQDEVRKHAAAMITSFGLILVFLVLYLLKVGGGPGEKRIVIEAGMFLGAYAGTVKAAYLGMLAIHILLSVVSVPVVLYALTLAATHSVEELRSETPHRKIGRVAAGSWLLSLSLGVVTYFLLNWVYAYEFVEVSY
jgi:putative membrane protein